MPGSAALLRNLFGWFLIDLCFEQTGVASA